MSAKNAERDRQVVEYPMSNWIEKTLPRIYLD